MKKIAFLLLFFSLTFTSFSQLPHLVVQSKHNSKVLQTELSPDRQWIATGDNDGKIIIWDANTQKRVRTFLNLGFPVKALIFHPRKNILLSASNNRIIEWDIYTGKIKRLFKTEHNDLITCLDFNHNGTYLVSGSLDETAIIWKFSKAKMKKKLEQNLYYNNAIYSVKFAQYENYVFTAGEDININMWDWKKQEIIRKFRHHRYKINNIALNKTNSLIASAGNDGKVQVWNVNTAKRISTFILPNTPVQNVIFHPEHDRVLAAYYKKHTDSSRYYVKHHVEGQMIMWDLNKDKEVWRKNLDYGVLDIAIGNNDNNFITANSDTDVKIFNLANGKLQHILGSDNQINDIVFIEERDEFITAVNNGIIKIWDSEKLKIKGIIDTQVSDKVSAIDYDYTSGNLIAAVGSKIFIWNYDYDKNRYFLINTFKIPDSRVSEVKLTNRSNKIFIKRKLSYNLYDVSKLDAYKNGIIPDDLVQRVDSVLIEVYNLSGNFLFDYIDVAHEHIIFANCKKNYKIAYNNSHNHIEESDYDENLSNSKVVFSLENEWTKPKKNKNTSFAENLASKADKLTGNVSNANIEITDVELKVSKFEKRKEKKRLKKINPVFSIRNDRYKHISYSDDGNYLATAGLYDYIEVYDLTKNSFKKIGKFAKPVSYFEFSTDNSMIASISGNKVQIWNTKNGGLEAEFETENSLTEVHFFENNKKLMTYGLDEGIKVWDITDENLIATIVSVGKNDFITISDEFYYTASENGAKGAAFYVDGTSVPIECLSLKYNRPEIVLDRLGYPNSDIITDYSKEYFSTLKNIGISQADFNFEHIPEITIRNKDDFKWYTYNRFIELDIKASDIFHNLMKMEIEVNGVPILKEKQKDITRYETDQYTHTYKVELNNGKNVIYTYTINQKGAKSIKDSLVVTLKNRKNTTPLKPDLYVIAFGTYDFANKNLSSAYTLKTTKALVKVLGKDLTKSYNKVIIDTLYGEEALKYKLLKLRRKYRKVGVDDEFIVLSSGYSVLKDNFDVFFATFNMDFSNPEKNGIAHKLINTMLQGIPARKKVLVVDSWRFIQNETAGNLDKNKNNKLSEMTFTSYDPAKDMRKNIFRNMYKTSGTTVLFTNQIQEESNKLELLAKTLLVGYNKKRADFDRNGIVSSFELNSYIERLSEKKNEPEQDSKVAVYKDFSDF